jgi:hypothetical protein
MNATRLATVAFDTAGRYGKSEPSPYRVGAVGSHRSGRRVGPCRPKGEVLATLSGSLSSIRRLGRAPPIARNASWSSTRASCMASSVLVPISRSTSAAGSFASVSAGCSDRTRLNGLRQISGVAGALGPQV